MDSIGDQVKASLLNTLSFLKGFSICNLYTHTIIIVEQQLKAKQELASKNQSRENGILSNPRSFSRRITDKTGMAYPYVTIFVE